MIITLVLLLASLIVFVLCGIIYLGLKALKTSQENYQPVLKRIVQLNAIIFLGSILSLVAILVHYFLTNPNPTPL